MFLLTRQSTSMGSLTPEISCGYPIFRQIRAAVKNQAELLAISFATRNDLTYGSDQEIEKAYVQYVSGDVRTFGLRPGRLSHQPTGFCADRLLTNSFPGENPVEKGLERTLKNV